MKDNLRLKKEVPLYYSLWKALLHDGGLKHDGLIAHTKPEPPVQNHSSDLPPLYHYAQCVATSLDSVLLTECN